MRRVLWGAAALWLGSSGAWAQDAGAVLEGPPPAATELPAAPGDAADQPAAKPALVPVPPPPAPIWQPHQTALLQVLDKVDGAFGTFTVPVGRSQTYRNLTIDVRSCFARPLEQPQDATAFLVISDAGAPTPRFTGWMLAAEPSTSMLEHPVYDVRVLGCR